MASPARTLVFVPLREEMVHIDSIATERSYVHTRGQFDERELRHTYIYTRPNGRTATLSFQVLGDAGNTRTAATIAAALQRQRPEVVLLAGLAGSLDPDQARLGDVFVIDMAKMLFADKIKDIDADAEVLASQAGPSVEGRNADGRIVIDDRKAIMGRSFLRYRRDVARGSEEGIDAAEYVHGLATRVPLSLDPVPEELVAGLPSDQRLRCANARPQVRTAVVLGSDMVVDSQDYIDFLQDRNADETLGWYAARGDRESSDRNRWLKGDIPIVDMESYGFFKLIESLRASGVAMRALAIRGVSDFASGKAALDRVSKTEIRRIAVRNAATVTLDLLAALDLAEISGRP